MSTTAYQTSAKPRGRRGSHSEATDKPSRSRASSSASTKLSKTLSRNLDEMYAPKNSRPSSPAIFSYRQRTLDPRTSDPVVMHSRHSTLSSRPDKTVQPRQEDAVVPPPGSPTKPRAHVVQIYHDDVRSFEVLEPHLRPISPPKASKHATETFGPTSEGSGTQSGQLLPFSHGLGRKTHSSKSLASMQPTVAEESEELAANEPEPASPKSPMSTPAQSSDASILDRMLKSNDPEEAVATSPRTSKSSLYDMTAMPSARKSISVLHEDTVSASPRTSKSSLRDTASMHLPRTSGSSLHEPLVAPTPQGHVTFMQPSLDQHLAESVERGIPASSSPTLAAEVAVYQDFIPQAHSPLGSPPLSPFMYHPVGSPPPQPLHYTQTYPFTYAPPFMPSPHFPPAFFPTPFTSPPASFVHPGDMPRADSVGVEDERSRLLEKVSNALPDLNRLLHYYQESQGLLSEKDNQVKVAESQHMEETESLRVELRACKEEYEKVIDRQARENLKLKGEIAEHAEKISGLENSSHPPLDTDEELAKWKVKYDLMAEEIEVGRAVNEELVTDRKLLKDEVENLKGQLHDKGIQHERLSTEAQQAHEMDMAAREQEHARWQHEHKTGLSKVQLDLAGMITKHSQMKKDLDSARTTISQHERALSDQAEGLEHTLRSHAATVADFRRDGEEEATRHKREIAMISQELSQTVAKHEEAQKQAEQRVSNITRDHEQREAKQQADLETAQTQMAGLRHELEEERTAQNNLKRDLATAQEAHGTLKTSQAQTNRHHAELAEVMLNLRNRQAEWQRESERMDTILQNLRQLTPSQGKDDGFL